PSTFILLLYLIRLKQHISILFPYTTLFRSNNIYNEEYIVFKNNFFKITKKLNKNDYLDIFNSIVENKFKNEKFKIELEELFNQIDRKSTRLNSSHVKISYAVFCLKKKTKK